METKDLEQLSDAELDALYSQKKFLESLPDEELNKLYSEKIASQATQEKTRPLNAEAALAGYGDTATLGYLPQIQAAIEPVATKIGDLITGQNVSEDLPSYVQRRDENISRLERLKQEAPKEFFTGQVSGAIASSLLPGSILGKGAEAATAMGRVGQAARAGLITGALQNPGDKQGELSPLQLGERAKNAAIGGAVGGAAQGAVEGVKKTLNVLKNAGASLKEVAANRAVKSTGVMLKDLRKIVKDSGSKVPDKAIQDLGDYLYEKQLVKPGMTFDDIADASKALEETSGKKIGAVLEMVKKSAGVDTPIISRDNLAQKLKSEMSVNLDIPGASKVQNVFDNMIEELTSVRDQAGNLVPKKDMTIDQAIQMRTALGKREGGLINWSKPLRDETNPEQLVLRKLYDSLGESIEETTDKFLGKNGASVLPAYKAAKKEYAVAKTINKIAFDQQLRQLANRVISPTDYLAGATGAAIGYAGSDGDIESKLKGAATGALLGGVNKVARRYGNPLATDVLYRAGNSAVAQGIEGLAEKALNSGIKLNPEQLAKFTTLMANQRKNLGSVDEEKKRQIEKMKQYVEKSRTKSDYSGSKPSTKYVPQDEAAARFAKKI